MFEKVNPCHPDKVADRIAGAIVDLAYTKQDNPKVAIEVLLGHGECFITAEVSVELSQDEVEKIVWRICGDDTIKVHFQYNKQDAHLSKNQEGEIKCGDNGIFKGSPTTREQSMLSEIVRDLFVKYPTDGKYILNVPEEYLVICQSNANKDDLLNSVMPFKHTLINPLGEWTGGPNVDSGATNRKLGSDMGDSVTGGGLHGKDLSKADVSVNILCNLLANKVEDIVFARCAIGDDKVKFFIGIESYMEGQADFSLNYREIVDAARKYIKQKGGFEKFAEWGLI